jgi:V8-like Glu-specific endopeptidase
VLQHSGLTSLGRWSRRQIECERAVCQIRRKTPGGKHEYEPVGTGFLVARARVMTNWHVFETPGSGRAGASADFSACFDYRAAEDGSVADEGISVDFAADAILDASHRDELDYVVVGLKEGIGEALMPDGRKRGWLALGTRSFEKDEALIVLQHPAGRTLEVSAGAVTGWHKPGAGFEHTAETDEGSSGSPCFGADWTLLGLHHRVDPITGARNRGIATSAILDRMGAILPPTIGLLEALD